VNKKLYVGNLPYTVTLDQLKDYFSGAGAVIDAVVIIDSQTGRSKGFGFVEFEKEEDAKKAIEMFGGKDFQGRNLVVNEARPKVEDGGNRPTATVKEPGVIKEDAPVTEEVVVKDSTTEDKPAE
jgi:cold-inducible RNA-binding protein